MNLRYVLTNILTNILAKDWQPLARFDEEVLDGLPLEPASDTTETQL